jgi:hypothetical protein
MFGIFFVGVFPRGAGTGQAPSAGSGTDASARAWPVLMPRSVPRDEHAGASAGEDGRPGGA